MQAVILAAGKGKRMQPLTFERPKPLIEVAGKTLLEHTIASLPPEVDEIILVVGYKGDQIRSFIGETFRGKTVRYVEQPEALGTSNALRLARPLLRPHEHFLLMYPDDIRDHASIRECVKHELSILVSEHPNASQFGVVSVKPDGTLESFIEKPENPTSNLIWGAVLVLNKHIFEYESEQHPNGEYYITIEVNKMAQDYPIHVVKADFWYSVTSPEDIPKVEELLKNLK